MAILPGARDQRGALFPPLPQYSAPTRRSRLRNRGSRAISATFQFGLIGAVAASAHIDEIKYRYSGKPRRFAEEEGARRKTRKDANRLWLSHAQVSGDENVDVEKSGQLENDHKPSEGGRDTLKRDVQYYARRCGLDCEAMDVITEDGFILDLWHIFDPNLIAKTRTPEAKKGYPILMIHGLLQSSGAYTCTDDHSFAFYFAKAGYDIWLGNNRCGFRPRHQTYKPSDPRMWAWNLKDMAMLDLPALVDAVLASTQSSKLALVGHSQGTSQMLIALHKDFVPELGAKVSVACLLAPAAYSGPILNNPRWFFRTMERMSEATWRLCFGKHAFLNPFLPLMNHVPMKTVSAVGYPLFHYLFKWSDRNWDAGLRTRSFMWAPTYVSSEHMRWWVGKDGFVKQQCILNTREESDAETAHDIAVISQQDESTEALDKMLAPQVHIEPWFDERAPPLAMWVAQCDELVDGPRLLRRFQNGREPFANLVHANVIEDYEHLDVIWAVDSIERVGKEVMDVIWKTVDEKTRDQYVIPKGVEPSRE